MNQLLKVILDALTRQPGSIESSTSVNLDIDRTDYWKDQLVYIGSHLVGDIGITWETDGTPCFWFLDLSVSQDKVTRMDYHIPPGAGIGHKVQMEFPNLNVLFEITGITVSNLFMTIAKSPVLSLSGKAVINMREDHV